jgi:ATP-dependent exoDNAse (exonuclease V) beta subunit
MPRQNANSGGEADFAGADRKTALERGIAVHGLLEWSANNDWQIPSPALAGRFAAAGGHELATEPLLEAVRSWLACDFFEERVRRGRCRAELPILFELGGTVLRGEIDLLVETEGLPPLIVDYKTDRLGDASPEDHFGRYETQQAVYAVAVAEAREAPEVELAYVFLERPEQPATRIWGSEEIASGRELLEAEIALAQEEVV